MRLSDLIMEFTPSTDLLTRADIEKDILSKRNGLIMVHEAKTDVVIAAFFTRGNALELHGYDRDIRATFGAAVWNKMAKEFENSRDNQITKDGRVISGSKQEMAQVLVVMQQAIGRKLQLDPESVM